MTAFARIGLRRTALQAEHLADAEVEGNLLQAEMSNKQPNLWRSSLISTTLVDGTATYTLASEVIALQAVYVTSTTGGTSSDRVIWPLSTYEYAAMPNKTQTGAPTSYWYNRQITPTITMWPVPDDQSTYTLNIRCVSQIEDASLKSGTTLNMPYRFLDVFVAGLAHRMARIYARDQEAARKADYMMAWDIALTQDQEAVPLYIMGNTSSYYR